MLFSDGPSSSSQKPSRRTGTCNCTEEVDNAFFRVHVVPVARCDADLSNFHLTLCLNTLLRVIVVMGMCTMFVVNLSCVDSFQNVCWFVTLTVFPKEGDILLMQTKKLIFWSRKSEWRWGEGGWCQVRSPLHRDTNGREDLTERTGSRAPTSTAGFVACDWKY